MMSPYTILAAFLGTIGFSIVYNIPKKYFLACGSIGAWGWILYSGSKLLGFSFGSAIFIATLGVALASRFTAVWKKCPEIIFLISGLFPLIPGADIYWTAYYIVSNNTAMASESGRIAGVATLSIVLGIVIIHELPQKLFNLVQKK